MPAETTPLAAVGIIPKESPAKVHKNEHQLTVGLPKEISNQEKRVAITPESVGLLTNNGIQVVVESGVGTSAKFSDQDYSDAGAKVSYSRKEVFAAQVVLKVDPPSIEEIGFMTQGSCLISALQLGRQNKEFIEALNEKKITATAFEYLELIKKNHDKKEK